MLTGCKWLRRDIQHCRFSGRHRHATTRQLPVGRFYEVDCEHHAYTKTSSRKWDIRAVSNVIRMITISHRLSKPWKQFMFLNLPLQKKIALRAVNSKVGKARQYSHSRDAASYRATLSFEVSDLMVYSYSHIHKKVVQVRDHPQRHCFLGVFKVVR